MKYVATKGIRQDAGQWAQGRNAELRVTLERVFAATLLFSAAAVVLVATGGPAVIQLMLQRGSFTSADGQLVARVWLALTAGLLGATWGIFLARLFQALQLPWVIATLACISVVVNGALGFAFLCLWGVVGVALASTIAYTVIMWLFHVRSKRALGHILGASARGFIGRAILANFVAYCAALWWRGLFEGSSPLPMVVGQFFIVAVANFLVARTAPLRLTMQTIVRG